VVLASPTHPPQVTPATRLIDIRQPVVNRMLTVIIGAAFDASGARHAPREEPSR
jgi:hypothetical protein